MRTGSKMQPRAPWWWGRERRRRRKAPGPPRWLCAGAQAGFLGSRKLRALTIPK